VVEEATIMINGKRLTFGEAMTVRVAIESFAMDLHTDGLGDDDSGKKTTALYLDNINAIRQALYKKVR